MNTTGTHRGPGSRHATGTSECDGRRTGGSGADESSGAEGQEDARPWSVPPPYDASGASLSAHSDAIGQMMAGRARLWLGPFEPPPRLPAGWEDTALVEIGRASCREGVSGVGGGGGGRRRGGRQ